MPERRRERRRTTGEPATQHRQERRQDKETRFVISAKDLAAEPEQIEEIKSALLRDAVTTLRNYRTTTGDAVAAPSIAMLQFSLSFSLSFSLGFGEPEELIGPAQ